MRLSPFVMNEGIWDALHYCEEGTLNSLCTFLDKKNCHISKRSIYLLASRTDQRSIVSKKISWALNIPIEKFGKLVKVSQVTEEI